MTQPLTADLPDLPLRTAGDPARPTEPDTPGDAEPRAKLFDLSVTQLLGGSMAAATAAALGSRLGVVGTIAGAAVLSVVSAIAGSLYTNSMSRARDVVLLVRSRRDLPSGRPVVAIPARMRRGWSGPDRATRRRTLATAGAVFALAAAFLAGLQLATGAPVTGTDLGGRTAAGAVVDGSVDGSADRATGTAVDEKAGDRSRAPASGPTATDAPTGAATGSGTDGAAGSSGSSGSAGSAATGTPTAGAGDAPGSVATPQDPAAPTSAATSPATGADGATPSAPASGAIQPPASPAAP